MSTKSPSQAAQNHLYYGDNLTVLRESVADESVDLIYLDPPFNSDRDYNILFKSPKGTSSEAQITAFEDSWHWAEQAEREFAEIIGSGHTDLAELMLAMRKFLGENDVMAYLTMMANRLLELKRVLKPTGSLFLHCDPTASHYLKLVLDGVFGPENFRNEIIWERTGAKAHASRRFASGHDTIFFYVMSDTATWNPQFLPHREEYIASHYSNVDPGTGRRYTLGDLLNPNPDRPNLKYEFPPKSGNVRVWRWTKDRMMEAFDAGRIYIPPNGGVPRFKRYLDEMSGTPITSVWTDIPPINSQAQERLGYPTQKPLALLERIISSCSNEGDTVLDPFCGCGTAVHAAQKLGRNWIGIDITHLAVSLIEKRLKDAFPGISFDVHGVPKDIEGARDLALRDKYQFQWWACSLVNAQPFQGKKKGADGGIDGLIFFQDQAKGHKKIVVSVKGGAVNVAMVRDLAHVVVREKADIGLFVSLVAPTKPMMVEAVKEGYYTSPDTGKAFPKLQILTIEGLLHGTERALYPDLSQGSTTFKKAKLEELKVEQNKLF
jgi:site-specific DNA-methyltransferase (adenine-specific)